MLIYLFWMSGMMIVYASFTVDADDRHDLILYNSIFSFLLPLTFLLTSGRARAIALVLFSLIAFPPALIETGWFLIDRSILVRNQLWAIFATNPAEVSGFLSMPHAWQWVVLACYICFSLSLLFLALRECSNTTNYPVSAIGWVLAASLCLIPGVRYNVPCINFYNSYRGYRADVQCAEEFLRFRQDVSDLVQDQWVDSAGTVVVIIGESLSKCHCSLYGYCRPTTPRLDQREDIIAYEHVRSSDFMTQAVLKQVLILSTPASPTLPELLHAAGWHTYWYDPYEGRNNTSNTMPTSFSSIARLCDHYYLSGENEQYDGALLTHLYAIVQDSATLRKAIFLHLIGNHFPYERRYPQEFQYFTNEDICTSLRDRLSAKQKAAVNAYDDAVRYNDWFIDSVLQILNGVSGSCAMLYFPDHGEEVYDEEDYAGRSFNHITPNLYEIPCIFWQNEAFAHKRSLYIDPQMPYCTRDMIHTLLDLFAVSYSEQDTCRSLFRPQTVNKP